MHPDWRCDTCGPVLPLHVVHKLHPEIVEAVVGTVASVDVPTPTWCPWPLPTGWTVTGIGWVGDERSGVRGTLVACSGPAPITGGPADLLLIAEELGLGLGARFAGLPGTDPGPQIERLVESAQAHAKIKAAGWPTPLWTIPGGADRSAYVGQAKGLWLYAISWPASAGYLLAGDVNLIDLTEWLPPELVFGAPSPRLEPPSF